MVYEFYANLFTSEPCTSLDAVLQAIPSKVNEEINEALCREYTNEEIKTALFQMGPIKAPGPDGFPALFYQKHWKLLEEDVCAAVKGFLLGTEIPEGFSDSSAFVPGRLITDNVLIAYECIHTIRKQKVKHPFFALKIDMTKAYDRVEWNYLKGVLLKMGFNDKWVETVMRCVTCVKYAQKEASSELKGIRNGRNGPPISHLLFADDSVFFTREDDRSIDTLKSALQTYCEGSGQKINTQKSSIFFGTHCNEQIKERLATVRADVAEPEENTLKPDNGGNWRPRQPDGDSQTGEGARGWQQLGAVVNRRAGSSGNELTRRQ
nr:uncharacterized protein LOC109743696 [Aegilops tauschii subsp. strangulata]